MIGSRRACAAFGGDGRIINFEFGRWPPVNAPVFIHWEVRMSRISFSLRPVGVGSALVLFLCAHLSALAASLHREFPQGSVRP